MNTNPSQATRFQEGQSGNPKGRPSKGYSITETVRAMMDKAPDTKLALAQKILDMALKGDLAAIKLVWAYMDGLPFQSSDMTSAGHQISGGLVVYKPEKNPL